METPNSNNKPIMLSIDKQLIYLTILVVIVYPLFFSKVYEILFDDNDCSRKNIKHDYHNNKFTFMILIGVAGIITGALLFKYANINIISSGMILGGILTIIMYTIYNWHNIAELKKVIITGCTIVTLLYVSYRSTLKHYNVNDDKLINIFTPNDK